MNSGNSYIQVLCLCGAYLKDQPESIGQMKVCPRCHGTVEVRPSDSDHPFPTLFLKATRITGKGKARWKLSDGFEGYVEQVALRAFEGRGWQGLWGESSLWEFLMALLFWDIFFTPLEGMWEPRYAEGSPIWEQDMPRDWGRSEFYERRKSLIIDRLADLQSTNLKDVIGKVYSANHGRRCRPIWNWEKFSRDQLSSVASAAPRAEFLAIMNRLLLDHYQTRSGMPDLFLWRQDCCAFVEVKGPRDKLSKQQSDWREFLDGLRFRIFVMRVEKE